MELVVYGYMIACMKLVVEGSDTEVYYVVQGSTMQVCVCVWYVCVCMHVCVYV